MLTLKSYDWSLINLSCLTKSDNISLLRMLSYTFATCEFTTMHEAEVERVHKYSTQVKVPLHY